MGERERESKTVCRGKRRKERREREILRERER